MGFLIAWYRERRLPRLEWPRELPRGIASRKRYLESHHLECLDHVVIFGERHLRSVLAEYVAFLNKSRPHQGLAQRVPVPSDKTSATASGRVIALPVLGGLHHEYRWAA